MGTSAVAMMARPSSRRILNPLTSEQRQRILDDVCYIISIRKGFDSTVINRTWGNVTIFPAKEKTNQHYDGAELVSAGKAEPGTEYTSTAVHGRIESMNSGMEDTYSEAVTTARQAADDIASFFNDDCPGLTTRPNVKSFNGVFVSTTPTPSPENLKQAHQMLRTYYEALCAEADLFYETETGKKNISSSMRDAAKYLGITKPWNYNPTAMDTCPACGSSVIPGIAICATCKAILDEPKARKFFPERFAQKSEQKPLQE